jgi:hypothetical protein
MISQEQMEGEAISIQGESFSWGVKNEEDKDKKKGKKTKKTKKVKDLEESVIALDQSQKLPLI